MTTEYVDEQDVRDLITSKNVDLLSTDNGFSLAVGFDQSNISPGKTRYMIGKELISETMLRVLKEKLAQAEALKELAESLDDDGGEGYAKSKIFEILEKK